MSEPLDVSHMLEHHEGSRFIELKAASGVKQCLLDELINHHSQCFIMIFF